jgi:hypothetical protein
LALGDFAKSPNNIRPIIFLNTKGMPFMRRLTGWMIKVVFNRAA